MKRMKQVGTRVCGNRDGVALAIELFALAVSQPFVAV